MSSRLLHHLRSLRRLIAFGLVLSTACAGYMLKARHRRSLTARALWLQQSCRSALRALGVSYSTAGTPPPTGSMIAPNHVSYLDILILAATTPSVFVAKREVRTWPVFGWFARMAGTRFVDRERRSDVVRVGAELAPAIGAGVSVILFLEGTSSDGQTVLPFKSSLLEPAVHMRWPVVPAALAYRVPAGHSAAQEVCWWGDMTLAPHLFNLAGLPRIDARLVWGDPVELSSNRKTLAAALRAKVSALHHDISQLSPIEEPLHAAHEESLIQPGASLV